MLSVVFPERNRIRSASRRYCVTQRKGPGRVAPVKAARDRGFTLRCDDINVSPRLGRIRIFIAVLVRTGRNRSAEGA